METLRTRNRLTDPLIAAALIVVLWQVVVWVTRVPPYILPGPIQVAMSMVTNSRLIAGHGIVTATEVILGLIMGTLLGVLSAMYLAVSHHARRFFMPVLVLSQIIPVFALAPLLTLWIGYGIGSKIVMAVLIIYFPVTSNFFDGLRNTPAGYLDLARCMNSSEFSTLLRIRVPHALPALASGLRLAAIYAPIGAVIGEWVGASSGLGYLMLLANGRVKTDLMFGALVALCLFTVLLRLCVERLARYLEYRSGVKNDIP